MTVELDYPFRGRWQARNSPAHRVPSHGTDLFGSSYAIDFVPVDDAGRSAPMSLASFIRSEPPDRFAGFGRPVLAPIAGRVVAAHDGERDHRAYRGLPSMAYAVTQRSRLAGGWPGLAGNHVIIDADGVFVALCHLNHGSLLVHTGDTVRKGEPIAACGNTGNSTEPHLHIQAVDRLDIPHAKAVPMTFRGRVPADGEVVDIADAR